MRQLAAIAALWGCVVGCGAYAQAVSGVQLIEDDKDGFAFRRVADGGSDAGLIVAPATFVFAPVYRSTGSWFTPGQGLGTECACADVTTPDGGAVTWTRSGVAWCTKADYSLVECGANKPRVMYDRGNPSALGVLRESLARTNLVLRNRDLSDAAWTKSGSMSCARTATGVDGVANSASTCTSSGSNQTVLQGVTVASARRNSSLYIQRNTGTCTVEVTRDNGSTWSGITGSLSSTIYKRVVSYPEPGCMYGGCIVVPAMTAVAANPTIGVRLGGSSCSVNIDLAQDEADYYPTSPITTAGATVTRPAEVASTTVAAFTPRSVSFEVARAGYRSGGNADFALSIYEDATNRVVPYFVNLNNDSPNAGGINCFWQKAGSYDVPAHTIPMPALGPTSVSCGHDAGFEFSSTPGVVESYAATVQPPTAATTVYLSGGPGSPGSENGAYIINGVCSDATPGRCIAGPNRAPRAVSWHGDSIAFGTGGHPVTPPETLSYLIGRSVFNKGVPSDNTAGCVSRFNAQVRNQNFKSVVWLCGSNDCINSGTATGHSTFTAATAALNQAYADGMNVVLLTVLPYAALAGNPTLTQQCLDAFNSDAAAWCASHPLAFCVDTYTALKSANPDGGFDLLNPLYDSGDGRHPNAAGSLYMAQLVADAGVTW